LRKGGFGEVVPAPLGEKTQESERQGPSFEKGKPGGSREFWKRAESASGYMREKVHHNSRSNVSG